MVEQKYQEAIVLYNNAMYEQALNSFTNLGEIKLSLDYVAQCEDKLFYIKMEKDLIICHYVNYAILYYKLAKLRMLGLIDESYELKGTEKND